ncbi:MAG: hypothetical protein RJB38_38 [Pseudomonadota bacterium]|jgi:uncharacterized protein (TIGR01777 family)
MKILLSGATGLVGQELGLELARRGHNLHVLTRNPERHAGLLSFPATLFRWDASREGPPAEAFAGVDAVVHLAGESIASARWTTERQREILDSRVIGTRHLVAGIRQHGTQVRTFVSASAVGIYGDQGDTVLEEGAPTIPGSTEKAASAVEFLAGVCQQWEQAATQGLSEQVRSVIVRIGIVLSSQGGALAEMLPLFRSGVGGALGSGRQWMSVIHVRDLARLMATALEDSRYQGVFNGVGPEPVTNSELTHALAGAVGKTPFLKTPATALRLALGGMAQAVLSSQRVVPRRAQELGFSFEFGTLKQALTEILGAFEGAASASDEVLVMRQWIPAPLSQVFEFFSSAHNLERITPPWLNFEVLTHADHKIEAGSLIDYRLRIHGVPVRWRTLIESWDPPRSFVDTQLKGPYSKWHHTHTFEPLASGVLIEDRVRYRVPLAALGRVVAGAWVRRDVQQIFDYRKKVIREIFSR